MNNNVYNTRPTLNVIVMSLLFAFFADIKCMTSIITSFGLVSEDSSIMSLLYMLIVFLIIITAFFSGSINIKNFGSSMIVLLAYCFALYFCSNYFLGPGTVTFPYFIVFTIAAVCIPSIVSIDSGIVIKAMVCYPVIGIFKADEIFIPEYNGISITMGQSYAFIIPVLATVAYLMFFYKHEKKIIKYLMLFISVVNGYYLLLLIMYGSRGPLVCFVGLLFFFYSIKMRDCNRGVYFNKKLIVLGLILLLLVYLMSDTIMDIIQMMSGDVYAIQKNIELTMSGDVSNGRNLLYVLSWDGFLSSPLLGNGFTQFYKNTTEPYPHNSVLQILYDGGLLFAVILFIPLLRKLKSLFKTISYDRYALISVFMFAGFVASLFSDDLWMQPMLWLFIGLVLTNNRVIQ